MVMRVGCQLKRSDPGTAVYSMKAVTAPVIRWNTILMCVCDKCSGFYRSIA